MRSSGPSSYRPWTGVVGSGPAAGPTKVPLAEPRSSTYQRVLSVDRRAWRRLTPESMPQSTSGWMLRLAEARPMRLSTPRTTVAGRATDGIGSSVSWTSYQSGSIQTSATYDSRRGAGRPRVGSSSSIGVASTGAGSMGAATGGTDSSLAGAAGTGSSGASATGCAGGTTGAADGVSMSSGLATATGAAEDTPG